mmetsp:Transcript_1332/g.1912  ORF Transcript_1332/g.1912 Transcript_1332/m.1912 type:complete len:86 (+) Transcript_1332:767-1024(+)
MARLFGEDGAVISIEVEVELEETERSRRGIRENAFRPTRSRRVIPELRIDESLQTRSEVSIRSRIERLQKGQLLCAVIHGERQAA